MIIDEFGKGTNAAGPFYLTLPFWDGTQLTSYTAVDGAGLLCGVLHHLLDKGDERPKALAATHSHEIFEGGFFEPHPHLAFGHMAMRMDTQAPNVEDQVTYLYK